MTTITILGKPYSVTYHSDTDMLSMLGSSNRTAASIRISKEMCPDQMDETLLHEVLHIISLELMLKFDEETIARIAVGIHSAGYRTQLRDVSTSNLHHS